MSSRIVKKLAGILIGALVGYIVGWIAGWNLVDPNLDLWALGALLGTLAGIVLGLAPGFWRRAGIYVGVACGLFLGWAIKALLLGDTPGGWGLLFPAVGGIAGGVLGARPAFRGDGPALRALVGALLVGFLGGFLIDAVLLDLVLGLVAEHSVLSQAPWVLLCGVLGGLAGFRLGRQVPQTAGSRARG